MALLRPTEEEGSQASHGIGGSASLALLPRTYTAMQSPVTEE